MKAWNGEPEKDGILELAPMPSPTKLTVVRYTETTPRTRLLTLRTEPEGFAFHAGQAVWLGRPDTPERRAYSIASAPGDVARRGELDFLIGVERNSVTGTPLGGVVPGDQVEVEGPFGGFELPSSIPHAPILLIGGGTGIAPLRSIWRECLGNDDTARPTVVYSARSSTDLVFLDELLSLQRINRLDLSVTITGSDREWSGERGRLTDASLERHVVAPREVRCAICGPAAFVEHVAATLRALGVPGVHIATERW